MTVGRVGLGVLSIGARSATGDDAAYLEWHLLDHLPEQYQIDGMLHGQRWASTPACHAARAAASERFAPAVHVTQYLMADPPEPVVDDFLALGPRLAELGRYPHRLPPVLLAGFAPQLAAASPRAQVSAGVVPFRPNRGLYLLFEEDPDDVPAGDLARWRADELLPGLVEVDGVAGAWWSAPGQVQPDRLSPGALSLTTIYLDGEPAEVADALAPLLRAGWDRWSLRPALAAPFETVRPWAWDVELAGGAPE